MRDAVPALSPDELAEVGSVLLEVAAGLRAQDPTAVLGAVCSDRTLFLALRRLARRVRNHRTVVDLGGT